MALRLIFVVFMFLCRHEGIFIVRGKEDSLVTRNLVPGKAVYGEKLIKVDVRASCCWCLRIDVNTYNRRRFACFFFMFFLLAARACACSSVCVMDLL